MHELWDIFKTASAVIVIGQWIISKILNIPIEIPPKNPNRGSFWFKKDK